MDQQEFEEKKARYSALLDGIKAKESRIEELQIKINNIKARAEDLSHEEDEKELAALEAELAALE